MVLQEWEGGARFLARGLLPLWLEGAVTLADKTLPAQYPAFEPPAPASCLPLSVALPARVLCSLRSPKVLPAALKTSLPQSLSDDAGSLLFLPSQPWKLPSCHYLYLERSHSVVVKSMNSGARLPEIRVLSQPISCCVTLVRLLTLSIAPFPLLGNKGNKKMHLTQAPLAQWVACWPVD